jgi:ribonuclease HI
MHDAHRIRKYWSHIPDCEEQGVCQFCGVVEDLKHIALKCNGLGQSQIWGLVRELWLKKHPTFPDLSFGVILGCGLVSIKDVTNRHLPGESRLFHILVSELLFLIWKIRNDCHCERG